MTEDELLRLSFAQIERLFEGYSKKDEEQWLKFRQIAYEVWRKGAKFPPGIDTYMPIGQSKPKEMTEAELDEIWRRYGKLKN